MKKNLKFIALGVIAALAVVSCNSDKFTINGDIDNLADQNVYLARDGENGFVYIDTTRADNGKFTFKGKLDKNDFLIVTFADMPGEIRIYADNSDIDVKGNLSNLSDVKVEGSEAYDYYKTFLDEEKENSDLYSVKAEAFHNAKQNNDTAAMRAINKELLEAHKAYSKKVLEKANARPGDIVSLIMAANWINTMNLDDFAAFYAKVPDEIKKDFRISYFANVADRMVTVSKGKDAPEFSLDGINTADTVSNTSIKGKITAIYITAPALDGNEEVLESLKAAKDKGVDVVIAYMIMDDSSVKDLDDYVKKNHEEGFLPVYATQDFAEKFMAINPRTFFIGKDGKFIGTAMNSEEVKEIVSVL